MARQYGITSTTYQNIIIDSGAVYKDYGETGQTLLGATRGGNVFSVETEYKDMEVDGARGPVKGSRRITNNVAMITANFVENTLANILLNLTGSSSTDVTTHDRISRSLEIVDADFLTNIAIVGEVATKGDAIICKLDNVISDGNFEINFSDKDESVITTQFKAHFDPSDLDTEPWSIDYPKA